MDEAIIAKYDGSFHQIFESTRRKSVPKLYPSIHMQKSVHSSNSSNNETSRKSVIWNQR